MNNHQVILIAHNLRSSYNVGSLLRTAEGLGVSHIYLTGYTPHPKINDDTRLPHEINKVTAQIHKTALGAENSIGWSYAPEIKELIKRLVEDGVTIAALEQTPRALSLGKFVPKGTTAIILGSEPEGLDNEILKIANIHFQIPMRGKKESFNVTVAAAIAVYHVLYVSP
jgi:tRNA G18 (ribose-2'-O)-methylase SpoU